VKLPPPATTVEIYLAAILERLDALLEIVQPQQESPPDIELREPVKKKRTPKRKGAL
jgi:hypothetical protein